MSPHHTVQRNPPGAIRLALPGGGRDYLREAGALQELLRQGIAPVELAGVSAGAIVACAYALHLPGKGDLRQLVLDTVPHPNGHLERDLWPFGDRPGLYKGKPMEEAFASVFKPRLGDARIPVHIVTVCLSDERQRIFSSADDPEAPTAKVVRASSAAWPYFHTVDIGNKTYADGGFVTNNPLDDPRWKRTDLPLWGFKLQRPAPSGAPVKGLTGHLGALLSSMISANEREDEADIQHVQVPLRSEGDSFDLEFGLKLAARMFEQGAEDVRRFLDDHYPDRDAA